jgi:hypothetical protein
MACGVVPHFQCYKCKNTSEGDLLWGVTGMVTYRPAPLFM